MSIRVGVSCFEMLSVCRDTRDQVTDGTRFSGSTLYSYEDIMQRTPGRTASALATWAIDHWRLVRLDHAVS